MKRDPWDTTLTALFYAGLVVLAVGLFAGLAAHPVVAAAWAALATGGAGWLGCLYLARVNTDRLRALSDAAREQRPIEGAGRQTVADVIAGHYAGRRVGDAERDVFVAALHAHYAAGRLTAAELEDRLAAALSARTIDDLALTVDELPSEVTGR